MGKKPSGLHTLRARRAGSGVESADGVVLEASVAVQNASVDVEEPCSWAMGIPRVSGTERDDVAGSDSGKAGIGRWIGLVLSSIRNVALSLLRYFFPDEFIPDAQRKVCVMPEGHFVAIFTTKTVKSP